MFVLKLETFAKNIFPVSKQEINLSTHYFFALKNE